MTPELDWAPAYETWTPCEDRADPGDWSDPDISDEPYDAGGSDG